MKTNPIARLAWIVPAALLFLTIHQTYTAVGLQKTLNEGVQTWAEVTHYERSDRKDVTYVSLDLRVHMPDGSVFEREGLTLPYSIGHRVQEDSVEVSVLPGSAQEVVFTEIGKTHVSIAWSNSAMSLIALIIALIGVVSWNRYLARKED